MRDAEARKAPLTVDTQPLPARAVTEVTVYCADHAGLFSKISGALAVAGASIVDARIHTLTKGMALEHSGSRMPPAARSMHRTGWRGSRC